MVQFWGVYGVLLSTVISMVFVGMPWLFANLFTTIFEKRMMGEYLKKLFGYITVAAIVAFLSTMICRFISAQGIFAILINVLICASLTVAVFCLLYRKTDEFQRSLNILDRTTRHKIKILRLLQR